MIIFQPGRLRKPRRGGMFIDTEPIHDFLFVFQRRDGDAGLRLTSAGIESASTIRPARGRAAEKQKELSVGCFVYKHATPTGFSEASRWKIINRRMQNLDNDKALKRCGYCCLSRMKLCSRQWTPRPRVGNGIRFARTRRPRS